MWQRLSCLSRAGSMVLLATGSGAVVRLLGDRRAEARPCSVLLCTSLTNVTPSSSLFLGIRGPAVAGQVPVDAGSHPAELRPAVRTGVRPVQLGPPPRFTPAGPMYLEFRPAGRGQAGEDLGFLHATPCKCRCAGASKVPCHTEGVRLWLPSPGRWPEPSTTCLRLSLVHEAR